MRFLAIILLALFMAQATGLAAMTEAEECPQACPDDDPGDKCPPICPSCTCISHVQPSILVRRAEALLVAEPPLLIGQTAIATFLPSPDPREILHVPKATPRS